MKKMVALLSLIFLLIILSACGGTSTTTQPPNGDPANDDAARIISSVVDAFIGQVNLELKAEGITEGVLATGAVDANGNINVELPETVPSTFLEPFQTADGCRFSPATSAESFSFEQLNVYANNQLVGTLTQGNATTVLARVFVTEDASIVCTDSSQNAEFKKGWNLVSFDLLTKKGQVIPSSTLAWAFAGNLPEPTDPNPTDPNPTDPNPTDPNPTDPNPDTTAPNLLSSRSTSNTTVELVFSEAITNATTPANYAIVFADENANIQPLVVSAASLSADSTTVTLTTQAQQEISYGFTSISVTDLAGNALSLSSSNSSALNFFGTAASTPQEPDFSIALNKASSSIERGQSDTLTLSLSPQNGFSQAVNLALSGLPSGVTATFSANPISAGSTTSVITLNASETATLSEAVLLRLTASSGTLIKTLDIALTITEQAIVAPKAIAYAFVNLFGANISPFTPSQTFNASGGAVTVNRLETGRDRVTFTGLDLNNANVQVTTFRSDYCQIADVAFDDVDIRCFDSGGNAVNNAYTLVITDKDVSSTAATIAYAYAGSPTVSSYSLTNNGYAFNAAGEAITANRTAVGEYNIDFSGLNLDPSGNFNVQVSSYGSNATCHYKGVTAGGSQVFVNCVDTAGAPVDSRYTVQVTATNQTSSARVTAYALANQRFSASYTPSVDRSYSENEGDITATRTGTGDYSMTFTGMNFPDGNVQVSSHDANRYCTIDRWSGETVFIDCFDLDGNSADSVYSISVTQ